MHRWYLTNIGVLTREGATHFTCIYHTVHRATVLGKTMILPRLCCLKHGSDSRGAVVVQWSCFSKIYGGGPACICIQGNIHLHSFEAYYSKIIPFRISRDFKVEYYGLFASWE